MPPPARIFPLVGLVWEADFDPTAGAGVAAPLAQFLIRTDTSTLYYKATLANTGWVPLTGGGGGGGTGTGTNCLVYRPGSGLSGPTVYEDWAALYSRLQILRLANNGGGCYTIMIDDTTVSPAPIAAGSYDLTDVALEGMWELTKTQLELAEGVTFTGLRKVENFLSIVFAGDTAPIQDLGVDLETAFYLGIGCELSCTGTGPMILYQDGSNLATLYMDDQARLVDRGTPVVSTENEGADLAIVLIGADAQVSGSTLEAPLATQITLTIQDDSATVDEVQPAIAGTLEVDNATIVRFDPNPKPPLPAAVASLVVLANNIVLVDPTDTDGPLVVTLPTAFNNRGRAIIVKNVADTTKTIEVTPNVADTIDGGGAVTMETPLGCTIYVSDGVSDWHLVSVRTNATGGSNCLIYKPDSGFAGPTVFEEWAPLYTALVALRAANNGDGCYTIMFDDTEDSPAIIPAGTYDMTNVTWEGLWGAGTDVQIGEGVVLQHLRQIQRYLHIRFTGATPPITDLGVDRAETLYLGIGCSIECEAAPFLVYADAAQSSSIELDDHANLNDAGSPVVATENEAADLRIDLIGAGSTVVAGTLQAAANTQITLYIQDDSAQVDETQPAINVAAVLEVNNSTKVRLDPVPRPPLGPITVDTAIEDGNQLVLVDPSVAEDPNTVTLTLPLAFNRRGQWIVVKNVTSSTNPIIVTAGIGDTVDGVANVSIETGLGFVQLVSDGVSVWRVVAVDDIDTDTSRSFLPEQWAALGTIAASDTNVGMKAQLSTNFDTFVMLRAGSLTGLVWRLNGGPITAGTLTVTVRINGATIALAGVSTSVSNQNGGRTTVATGAIPYVAGDLIDVQYTCDAGLLPTATMNLEATVEVTQ